MSGLADVLRERGWSAARLAAESGVAVRTIDRWLSGQTTPRGRTAHAVAYALGEPVDRLIGVAGGRTALDAAITARGRTTNELASEAGVDPATISYLRAGRRQPTPGTALAIAEALGASVGELFPGETAGARSPFEAAVAASGLTYRQLAQHAGVGITTIGDWVAGSVTPRADKADAVARALGKPVEQLFTATRRYDLPLAPAPAKTLTAGEALAAQATGDPKWSQQAACAAGGHDRELWFPPTADPATKARQVCAGCPVVGDCRDAFLAAPAAGVVRQEMDRGIWAGLRGYELRTAARDHRPIAARGPGRAPDRDLRAGTPAHGDGRPARPTRGRPGRPPDAPSTRLARVLEDRGLTHGRVAEAAGVRSSTLSNWVRGTRAPTAAAAGKVAAVLDVPVAQLFDRVHPDITATVDRASPALRQALADSGLSLPAAAEHAGLAV
ncbi:MAG: helix-turn-helix domain-containing protein, partial [Alphaproteobacteria bacterium]